MEQLCGQLLLSVCEMVLSDSKAITQGMPKGGKYLSGESKNCKN